MIVRVTPRPTGGISGGQMAAISALSRFLRSPASAHPGSPFAVVRDGTVSEMAARLDRDRGDRAPWRPLGDEGVSCAPHVPPRTPFGAL